MSHCERGMVSLLWRGCLLDGVIVVAVADRLGNPVRVDIDLDRVSLHPWTRVSLRDDRLSHVDDIGCQAYLIHDCLLSLPFSPSLGSATSPALGDEGASGCHRRDAPGVGVEPMLATIHDLPLSYDL